MKGRDAFGVLADHLISTTGEWEKETALIRKALGKTREIVDRSTGYWTGVGGEYCRNGFIQCLEEMDSLVISLERQSEMLLKIAGVYMESEKENVECIRIL